MSTTGQTVQNQRRELTAAERRGWEIMAGYADQGISDTKGRDKRPAFDRSDAGGDPARRIFVLMTVPPSTSWCPPLNTPVPVAVPPSTEILAAEYRAKGRAAAIDKVVQGSVYIS